MTLQEETKVLKGISWTPAEAAAYASLTRPFPPPGLNIVAGYTS